MLSEEEVTRRFFLEELNLRKLGTRSSIPSGSFSILGQNDDKRDLEKAIIENSENEIFFIEHNLHRAQQLTDHMVRTQHAHHTRAFFLCFFWSVGSHFELV